MSKFYSRASFTLALATLYFFKAGIYSAQIASTEDTSMLNLGVLTSCAGMFFIISMLVQFDMFKFIRRHDEIITPASYILMYLDGFLPTFYYFIIAGVYLFVMITESYVQGKIKLLNYYFALLHLKYNPLKKVIYRDSFFKELPLAMKGKDFLFVNTNQIPKPWPNKYVGINEDTMISYIEKKVKCMEDVVVESI